MKGFMEWANYTTDNVGDLNSPYWFEPIYSSCYSPIIYPNYNPKFNTRSLPIIAYVKNDNII